jgi:hypothetical protein
MQQVVCDLPGRGALLDQDRRGASMGPRLLHRREQRGDRLAHERMNEPQGKARAQHPGRGQHVGGARGALLIEAGEPGRLRERCAVAEDRRRLPDGQGRFGHRGEPRGDRLDHAPRQQPDQALGCDRRRRQLVLPQFSEQLRQHERIAPSDPRARDAERVVGFRELAADQGRHSLGAQRR